MVMTRVAQMDEKLQHGDAPHKQPKQFRIFFPIRRGLHLAAPTRFIDGARRNFIYLGTFGRVAPHAPLILRMDDESGGHVRKSRGWNDTFELESGGVEARRAPRGYPESFFAAVFLAPGYFGNF